MTDPPNATQNFLEKALNILGAGPREFIEELGLARKKARTIFGSW